MESENAHLVMKIFSYVISVILTEEESLSLKEEFKHLAVAISKCSSPEALDIILSVLNDLLTSNQAKYQTIFRETEIFSVLIILFLSFFPSSPSSWVDYLPSHQMFCVMKNILENSQVNAALFTQKESFSLIMRSITRKKEKTMINDKANDSLITQKKANNPKNDSKSLRNQKKSEISDFLCFLLREEAKNANLQTFLELMLEEYDKIPFLKGLELFDIFFKCMSFETADPQHNYLIRIFKEALIKKYNIFGRLVEGIGCETFKNRPFWRKLGVMLRRNVFLDRYMRRNCLYEVIMKKVPANVGKREFIELVVQCAMEEGKLIFPKILSVFVSEVVKGMELADQHHFLEKLEVLIVGRKVNTEIIRRAGLLESICFTFREELKNSMHPFFNIVLVILNNQLENSPNLKEIRIFEEMLLVLWKEGCELRRWEGLEQLTADFKRILGRNTVSPSYYSLCGERGVGCELRLEKEEKNKIFSFFFWARFDENTSNILKIPSLFDFKIVQGHLNVVNVEGNETIPLNHQISEGKWRFYGFTFNLRNSSDVLEFGLFIDGLSQDSRVLRVSEEGSEKFCDKIWIGGKTNFDLGPIYIYNRLLTPSEINLFYSSLDSRGLFPSTTELKRINLSLLSLPNLKLFDILLGRLDPRLNYPFQLIYKPHPSLDSFEKNLICQFPSSSVLPSHRPLRVGQFTLHYIGDPLLFQNYPLTKLLEQSDVVIYLLELLNKSENRGVFNVILEFIAFLLENSEESARGVENQQITGFLMESLKKNRDFVDVAALMKILRCCCKSIEGNRLLMHARLFRMVFQAMELYGGVLGKVQQRVAFFNHLSEKLLDSSHNIFYK